MFIKRILLLVSTATLLFSSGAFAAELALDKCDWKGNNNNRCNAVAKFIGTVLTAGTYSADKNSIQTRFYMKVTEKAESSGCYNSNDGTTLAVIASSPPLEASSFRGHQVQEWRNMVMVALTTGMPLTIFTDGACNVYEIWLK